MLPILSFREYCGTVTAGEVQAALRLMAGENLRLVDLADCALLDAAAAEAIMRQVQETCLCEYMYMYMCVWRRHVRPYVRQFVCVCVCDTG